ncbi:MAG: NADH-quinone oxidoreductase subunit NuoI [Campylobacteraceae bacterium]|jgi:NADH-quinone oxidoreductase subunit I|nr:NADH-quinone oxidoreductase subunit NuoI [Campylobacteraceae bacterium]
MLDQFTNRNTNGYIYFKYEPTPKTNWQKFCRVVKRSIKLELFAGLWIVFREMAKGKKNCHTTQYPLEKMPIGPRYRSVHRLLRLLESGSERCIGCGLCEKICVSNCIRMDTGVDQNGRKAVKEYSINFGRCIYCGLCAEVCPELAIVHGSEYEYAAEQRAYYGLKEDMLTPIDKFKNGFQEEFEGYGSISSQADKTIKKTPIAGDD